MTSVLYTVDTELSPGLHRKGVAADENLKIGVLGSVSDGEWGIGYQMRRLNEHNLKGVFFVEALCSYVVGEDILKRIVGPILESGHEVQLHLHTEWLRWFGNDVLDGRQGSNISEFELPIQKRLLDLGLEALQRAGAPKPTAFRAGNYGANNDTLRALTGVGIRFDSSYNYAVLGGDCRVTAPAPIFTPQELEGVVEVPITVFEDYPGHIRPLQLCAVSASEMRWAISESIERAWPTAVVVSHGFELLNATRTRSNPILLRRFDRLCSYLSEMSGRVRSVGFAELAADTRSDRQSAMLASNVLRTTHRTLEQAFGRLVYDRR